MSRSLFRSISTACIVAAMLCVSGCSSMMLSQKVWAGALEPMTGITSIDLKYSNNWPTSGKQFVAKIVVSPDLSEAQARAIAAESCRHSANITDIRLDTSATTFAQQRVVSYEFANTACIDAEQFAYFSRTAAAIRAMPDFEGEVLYFGPFAARYDFDNWRDGAYEFGVTAPDTAGMLDALRAVRTALPELTLNVWGDVSEPGVIYDTPPPTLSAHLTPDADVARLMPLIAQSMELEAVRVDVTDEAVTIFPRTSNVLDSSELQALKRFGESTGFDVSALFLPFRDAGTETEKLAQAQLVAEILAAPGGASIQEPASSNLSIEVHDAASIEAVAQLLAAAPDNYLPLRLYGPGTQKSFWVALKPGEAKPEDVATTVPAAWALRDQISTVDRVILTLVDGNSELAVYLESSATAADVDEATKVLTPLARDNVFDAVRLSTPFTEYLGEPVA